MIETFFLGNCKKLVKNDAYNHYLIYIFFFWQTISDKLYTHET
jgi:hypothetical protein